MFGRSKNKCVVNFQGAPARMESPAGAFSTSESAPAKLRLIYALMYSYLQFQEVAK